MTLNAAFIKVFGDELTKRGYIKLKGSHTYYARLVNNEFIHFITYMKEKTYTTVENSVKLYAFDITGGVETVYRPCIELGKTPGSQDIGPFGNMTVNFDIYMEKNPEPDADAGIRLHKFRYNTEHDEITLDSFGRALAVSREYLIPEIEKADNIKACIDFFCRYNSSLLFLYSAPENIFIDEKSSNESLLYFLTEDYSAIINDHLKTKLEREKERIRLNLRSHIKPEVFEKYREDTIRYYKELTECLDNIYYDKPLYAKVMTQLSQRKQMNLERAVKLGLHLSE